MMAKPMKILELHHPMIQFLTCYNQSRARYLTTETAENRRVSIGQETNLLCLKIKQNKLTIIPRACVGYELAIIISYPTNTSGIFVSLKSTPKLK